MEPDQDGRRRGMAVEVGGCQRQPTVDADPDAAAWCPLRCGADTRPRNGGLGAAAEAA